MTNESQTGVVDTPLVKEAAPIDPKTVKPEDDSFANILDKDRFDQLWRMASILAKSALVPEAYKGKVEDCFVACQMALRLQIEPMMVLQNVYVVKGRPGMEAKLAIALVNARGPFLGPIDYDLEGEGDSRKCTAFATLRKSGRVCKMSVSIQTAKDNGWYRKDGSWEKLPELMLRYRSAAFLIRVYAPEVLLGMQTTDELKDVAPRFVESVQVAAGVTSEPPLRRPQARTPQQPAAPQQAQPDPGVISGLQRKRMFAIMHKCKVSEDLLCNHLHHNYAVESTFEVRREDYADIIDWIETQASANPAV